MPVLSSFFSTKCGTCSNTIPIYADIMRLARNLSERRVISLKVKIDAEILTCDVRKKPNQAPFVSIQFFDGEGKVRDGYGILDQNTSPDLGKLSRNDRVILAGDVYVKEGRLKLRLTGLEPA